MVKHIILWTLKDEYNNDRIKQEMKVKLEGLVGVVPGLSVMKIEINPLPSSNADVMLYSEFENEEALRNYATHPEHVKVADTNVCPFTDTRTVIDFEEN